MITVTILQNQKSEYVGIHCVGHAGFDDYGKDIVCAAVSILVINTINGIEQFTEDAFVLDVPAKDSKKKLFGKKNEDNNIIDFRFTEELSEAADVLMKTLVLGLSEIQNTYGKSYLTLKFREV